MKMAVKAIWPGRGLFRLMLSATPGIWAMERLTIKRARWGAVWVAGLLFAALSCSEAAAQNSRAGRIVGYIDGIHLEGSQYYVFGWACQQGNQGSIGLNIYADRSAFDTPPGTYVLAGEADLDSEPAVNQQCQDTKGGQHRFKVELPNQLLRTYQKKKLYVHGIAIAGNVENSAIGRSGTMQFPKPVWPTEPVNPNVLDGQRVAVFDTARDSCEQIDIPDAMARAFRDYKGTIHLIASHYITRASLGPTLESVKHNCQVVYNSHHDANPANYDDATWLDSFYNIDGKKIVALGHMEYHGFEHPGMCSPKGDIDGSCWYNAATFHISGDGGYHFAPPKPPANYILGLPYKYQVNQGPEGYSIDTNIVKAGDWYYAVATDWPWPPRCGEGKGAQPCLVPGGGSPIRTANILDPSSWRGWDGKDFNVVFADPYRGAVASPQDHVYTPVPYMDYVNGINFYEPSHLFIATLWDKWDTALGPPGLYFSTSSDFIHWSKPALAITQNQLLQREPEGNWSYAYFSLIDPKSTDPSYSTVTDNPYLFYVRSDDDHGPYKRVLFRQKIKLGWLAGLNQNSGAPAGVGHIAGNIDGISQDGDHFFISGWACQQGQKKSIVVHVYAENATDPAKTTFVLPAMADLNSEPAVGLACQDHEGGKHRFLIALPYGYGPESKLDVHGIRVVDGVPNDAIAGSGAQLRQLPMPELLFPSLPPLSGSYHNLGEHPRVFTTAAELKDLVARINRQGSYSGLRFGLLADQIKHDVVSGIDWDVTYSGCNVWIYQYVFSYEPQDHHEAEIRSELQISPGVKAPAGAAVVAARLALYAALLKAGAAAPPGAPSADQATALAKRILLAWANHGFPRDTHGHLQGLQSISCRGGPELDLGRGVLYSVQAQDLLESFGALNAAEEGQLDAFHSALFELLRQGDNVFFAGIAYPYSECARYTNLAANALVSLLATARLLDDGRRFDAVLHDGDRSVPVMRPWLKLFDRAIYGESDTLPECAANNLGPDSLTSLKNHWDFQTPNVAPGEIADRGRNANAGQGIGYPMFTLERLFDAAEILRIAGYDPYGYRGAHKQSLEMAMRYYACYAKGAGFYNIVTANNSGACPDAAQYYGKLVNGVDRMVLFGAYRFPQNSSITDLEAPAKTRASSGAFSTDAILFGKWRD